MAQVTVDVPSFALTVEKKQPVQVRTDVSFAKIASHGEDGFIQYANSNALGSHPSLAFNANTNTTSIESLNSVDAVITTANITTANISTLFTGSTIVSDGQFGDVTITDGLIVGENVTVSGNLTVTGQTTTIESTVLTVDDKHIELASTDSPSDVNATGGGIILKGDTDKTIIWANSTKSWNFNQDVDIKKVTSADSRLLIDAVQVANSSLLSPSSKIIVPIANITTANVATAYVTDLTVYNAFQVGSGTTTITTDYLKTGVINITTSNIATSYITSSATIFKEDVEESNVTVANVGTLFVSGDATVHGDITIGGEINLGDSDTDSLTIAADLTSHIVPNVVDTYDLGDDTKRWRNVYLSGAAHAATKITTPEANISVANVSTLFVTGDATVHGDITIGGAIALGDADTDSLTIAADLTSHIVPNATNTYDLGTDAKRWKDIYLSGAAHAASKITTPEANITVSNTVTSYTTSSLVLPVGDDAARVDTQGGVRYSTTQSTFEGYDGSAWGSLGGVIDIDQDTYIKAETSAGADNDILDFFVTGTRQAYISNAGVVAITTKMTVPEANVTVANVGTLHATTINTGTINASDGTTAITIDDSTAKVILAGDLQVDGTTTTLNSTTLTVDDKNIVVASGAADSAAADGAGLTVDGASATILYQHNGTKWIVNKPFTAAEANLTVANIATSYTTSSLVLPVGDNSTRVNSQGGIRYSTSLATFEGYDGSNWGSLGGVIDVDQDTYITAEATADKDSLDFFTAGSERMSIDSTGDVTIDGDLKNAILSTAKIGTPTEATWNDGALTGINETYDSHVPLTGFSSTDNIPDAFDNVNELMHNIYKETYVRHAKFSANVLSGPATLTTTFTVDSDVYNGYDANSYEWIFGDGGSHTTTSTSYEYDYTGASGGTFDVTLTARNTSAPAGTAGSYATFKRTGYIVVYTPAPVALFTYAYNQKTGSVAATAHTTTPAYIDETLPESGTTHDVTFNVTTSTDTTHWVIDFGDGTTYPATANPNETNQQVIEGNSGSTPWEVYSTTKITTHPFAITTQDLSRSVILYVWSSTAGATGAKAYSSTLDMRMMKDYTGLLSFTTSPSPATNNNDTASWNNTYKSINTEGVYIEFTPALTGSNAVNGTYGSQLSWNLVNSNNSESTTTFAYSAALAQKNIVFTRANNTSSPDGEVRNIALTITSQHTSTPFTGGNADITIKRDPRADFTGQFDTLTSGQSGSSNQIGYIFTDYNGDARNILTFTDSSDNNGITGWSWDVDKNVSAGADYTTQNPQHTYTAVGNHTVELTLTHPNTYGSNDVDYIETKTNYITISSNPTAPATLVGKTISITNDGTYTAKLCSGVTNNSSESAPAAGATVTRTEDTTPTSGEHSYANEFPSNGDNTGNVRAVINGTAETGGSIKTFTTGSDTGTTGSLIITYDIDSSASGSGTQNTIPNNWYRVFKSKVESSSALSAGVNTYAIRQLFSSGSTQRDTAVAQFVVDTMTTAPAVQSGYAVGLDSIGTPRYMSQIRYFDSSGSLSITSLDINNLSGQTYADEDPLEIAPLSGSLLSTTTKSYGSITGISTPLAVNLSPTGLSTTVSVSGSGYGVGTIKLRSRNINGYGSYQNNSTNSLYWYNSVSLDEQSMDNDITGGTAISGKGDLIRVEGFDDASVYPSYTAANFYADNNWVSATEALGTYEAPLLYTSGGRFVWDDTNWQTYLPGLTNNPNNSSRGAGNQFVTLVFSRKAINSFTIKYTGTIASLWIALPGLGTDTSSGFNGWLDCNTDYGGAGQPGSGTGGNGGDGVRDPNDGGTGVIGSAGTNATFKLNLGTASTGGSGSIALDCPILIRFGLASDKHVSNINVEN